MKLRRHVVVGAVALLCALPGFWVDPRAFHAAWLAVAWYAVGIVLGSLANGWLHRLTGGRWGDALQPARRALARRLPWALLLLAVPLAFGLRTLYPWAAQPADVWARDIAQPAFVRLWLDPLFFGVRVACYGAAWLWLALAAARPSGGRAAASLVVYVVVTSLAAIDLLMSLLPAWYSSVFALAVLAGQMLAGAAVAVGLTASCRRTALPPPAPHAPPLWRDFGNLLMTWLLSWAYLAFVQLLIIWAENLPREIAWYVPRLQGGWSAVGVALVVLQLALPLFALLFRQVKDDPARLALVAFGLVATGLLDAAWLVLPSVQPGGLAGWWLVPLLAVGIGLLLFGGVPAAVAGDATMPAEGSDGRR
jgi:hypothetical protein